MTVFRIPCSLRQHTAGHPTVAVPADDLPAALGELARLYPECGERVLDRTGHLREWVRVLRDGEEVSILPSVCGG